MLKLTFDIGDIARLDVPENYKGYDAPIDITIDRTRDTGARILVRDDQGNGVDAWLEIGDNIHIGGYFDDPVRIELAARSSAKVKLIFDLPDHVRVERVCTAEQADADTAIIPSDPNGPVPGGAA